VGWEVVNYGCLFKPGHDLLYVSKLGCIICLSHVASVAVAVTVAFFLPNAFWGWSRSSWLQCLCNVVFHMVLGEFKADGFYLECTAAAQ